LAVLWGAYDFRFHAAADGSDDYNEAMAGKIAALRIPQWRERIGFLDAHQLLPRPYLWGLADTVRAGVEGRGESLNLLWGRTYMGKSPWFTFPSYLLGKLPLGLLALAGLGLLALVRLPAATAAEALRRRALLLALGVLALGHLLALGQSQGTYAGIRHALPVVVVLAVLGGAAIALALRHRARVLGGAVLACLAATVALTIREPRLWEYHNELAGGTANAWRAFGNEGLDLGQRAFELAQFHDAVIAPTGQPLYSGYWFAEEQARALGLNYARRVLDLDDTNVEGIYEGFVVYGMENHVPMPQWDHDPVEMFAGLERVARFGHIEVWRGRQARPKARASALSDRIGEYIYEQGGQDWEKVAARSREVLAVLPKRFPDAIELGNALLRLGRGEEALAAYRQPLAYDVMDPLTRQLLERRIAELERGTAVENLEPLVNPWRE
jgi:tetratricopeptide (TPR) repeat protein